MQQPGSQAGDQRGPQAAAAAADEDTPFAVQAATTDATADEPHSPQHPITVLYDTGPLDDSAAIAAEAADDLSALPDTATRSGSSSDAASKVKGATATPDAAAPMVNRVPSGRHKHRRKMIPLKRVMRDTYEYHGLNDLFFFCITALSVTLVLYWHWGETTATFKATVQSSFQSYGNPDWQHQSFSKVDTMFDAVEYVVGWLEFNLQRSVNTGWPNNTMRLGEFANVKYARMLVNLDRNCKINHDLPKMLCYKDDPLTVELANGRYGNAKYENILEWAGWTKVGRLQGRDSQDAGWNEEANTWWTYPVIAPAYNGRKATLSDSIGRMYNITRATNLNYNECDWAAYTCQEVGLYTPNAAGPKCAQIGAPVPFQDWWSSQEMCASNATRDKFPIGTRALQRGQRYFARHPRADLDNPPPEGNVVNLKPFLTKYAYSIALDVLASNAASQPAGQGQKRNSTKEPDMALFTMIVQRSAQVKDKPDRLMWQITTTLPVRTDLYSQTTDMTRIAFEVLMHICIFVVLSFQVWQVTVCKRQHGSLKPWVKHIWNCFELLSNITLLAWVVFYWVLYGLLILFEKERWNMDNWDMVTNMNDTASNLNRLTRWSGYYSTWLYMGIVVDFLICLRLTRYMRIHVGLKAFYQVFIIAAREFLDFAVFLFYILVLLGSAVFAFFQLTGGNTQFLRFPDGLSLMSRLTFGFLSYDEFQSQALGVGAAVSAVTGLFWVAVLLLVVYTQNIILAIVAEAYEEAKAKLGTAKTSFLMLVLMRILFTTLFVIYRIRMLCHDILYACTGWGRLKQVRPPSFKRGGSMSDSTSYLPGGPDHQGPPDGGASCNNNKSANGQCMDADDDDYSGFGDDQGMGLAPTTSRAVLPFDVEEGLAGSYTSSRPGNSYANKNSSRMVLLGGHKRSSPTDVAPGAGAGAGSGTGLVACPGVLGRSNKGMSSMGGRSLKGDEPQSLGQRLSSIWHDVILGERHMLRMYSDVYLAPGESGNSWAAKWKGTYWRPWCVARTAPLRCLMNLYQDFASYKLKQEFTWMANPKAKEKVIEAYRAKGLQPGSITSQASGGSSSSAPKDAADAASSPTPELPQLADEAWVTEDELARLFVVASKMSSVPRIWHSPFRKLTQREVEYLVQGIAEVYGRDEEDWLQERQQLLANGGSDDSLGSMKDARLGLGAPRKTGGFFSGLNQKRRDGGAEHGRQVTLLLHANKRLEDATHKTAAQLSSTTASLKLQMNAQHTFQRKQHETNAELLRGLHDLHKLLQPQQHAAGQPTASGAQLVGGVGAPAADQRPGSSAHGPTPKRFTSVAAATSKIFGVKAKVHSSGDHAQLACGGEGSAGSLQTVTHPMRSTSNISTRSGGYDPDALEQLAEEDEAAGKPAASDNAALVLTLQQQLEQQQKAMQAQQELLQQVLARLPTPQP